MSDLLIIPLLNKKVILFKGPPLIFDSDTSIEKLSDDEHSAFFRGAGAEYKSVLDINRTRCIKHRFKTGSKETAKFLKTKTTFCLNLFSQFPVVTSWAGILSGTNQLRIKEIEEFEALAGINRIRTNQFKINSDVNRSSLTEIYSIVGNALGKSPEVMFTLEKYNSSLLRTEFFDRVVDTTICFETLIPGNSELTYKLSLYIAFITSAEATERQQTFEGMKKLYEVRSKIVHGDLKGKSIKTKLSDVETNWGNYMSTLKSAVTYYLIFLSERKKDEWEAHLKQLVLGTEAKIL